MQKDKVGKENPRFKFKKAREFCEALSMTTFDDAILAIKEAEYFAFCSGNDQVITFSKIINKFCVYGPREATAGVFIERVRADAKED